ncbi:universal stress protein [Marinobacterium lutimaris]|uniref:Nucleotide-binding universal stress protein, UspA family n=1 Tax=Marinobacterium lutimaris TaxID=568106 RepID=A0A1H6CEP4_9GAMM|nr:universal stress protein [Marinobacterium lutimaris]SEG71125.1 Nucleotide-binding universal stress protein, UspA family [Marinobacterium lutimaris]
MSLPEIKTILYTSSLGEHTRPVFRQAVQMANKLNARLLMLHVVEPVGEMGRALIHTYLPDDVIKQMHDEGIARVMEQMKTRVEKYRDEELKELDQEIKFEVEPVIAEGQHAETILAQAEKLGADLIVMGQENTFGHHSATTHQVVRRAKIPVFVVPTGKKYM